MRRRFLIRIACLSATVLVIGLLGGCHGYYWTDGLFFDGYRSHLYISSDYYHHGGHYNHHYGHHGY